MSWVTLWLCHLTFTDKKVCQPSVAIWVANCWSWKYDLFAASFTDQVVYCVSITRVCLCELPWQLNDQLDVWQLMLTMVIILAPNIFMQHWHVSARPKKTKLSQVHQSCETKGLVMLLPLTRRLFRSSHRGLAIVKKISYCHNKKVAKLKSS